MPNNLPTHFLDLVYDSLLKSYWRKNALRRFLRLSGISESYLSQLHNDETKRDWLDRLFPQLHTEEDQFLIAKMAKSLSEQESFPDLENYEDSELKIREAKEAVAKLRSYLRDKEEERWDEKQAQERREKSAEQRRQYARTQTDLAKLKDRLEAMTSLLGKQKGGYGFQDWFYDFLNFEDIENRRPYIQDGRQIDGSLTLDGTTYLIELKYQTEQSGATDIDLLFAKVRTKADNTMAIFVSMSGYSSVAIKQASFAASPLLLFDSSHIYMVLTGMSSFIEVLRRVRRHSSQTGQAYLHPTGFGG
jgi:hypothetical protein